MAANQIAAANQTVAVNRIAAANPIAAAMQVAATAVAAIPAEWAICLAIAAWAILARSKTSCARAPLGTLVAGHS